jgi:hypothetical protein
VTETPAIRQQELIRTELEHPSTELGEHQEESRKRAEVESKGDERRMLTLRNGSLGALQLVLMSLALQLVATRAFATVGEPVTVELVGYDVRDQKIYYLTHIYELPRLSFIRIAGPNAGRVVIARSYYAKPYRPDGQDPAFFPKVKRLRRRLKRLKPIAEARRASRRQMVVGDCRVASRRFDRAQGGQALEGCGV